MDHNQYLLAARVSTDVLVFAGLVGGSIIMLLSFLNWRLAVKSVLVVLLFEGAMRKWMFVSLQELVYFLKDGILLGAYLRFFFFPDPEIRARRMNAPVFTICMLGACVSLSAFNPNINSVLVALYGVKIYFYYVPLAFMMPYLFRSEDEFMKQLRWYALLATPICLIGVLQFAMPGSSIWNVYAHSGAETAASNFGAAGVGEKIRITGTFSYLTGHTTFCIFFTAIHLALLVNRQTKAWMIILTGNLALLFANGMMGGSRTCVFAMGGVLVLYAVLSLGRRLGTSENPFVVVAMAVSGIVVGGSYYFYTAWIAWSSRLYGASDSVKGRIIDHTRYAMSAALSDGGLFGFGIGTAHPASDQLRQALKLDRQLVPTPSYDHEMGQVMVELGLVGFIAWYVLRVMTTMGMWRAAGQLQPGILRALLVGLALISLFHLYFLQVVYNHTAAVLIWASYGLALIPSMHSSVAVKATPNQARGSRGRLLPARRGGR